MSYIISNQKKIINNHHKNLFILGNGNDLSLQIPSGFSQYITSDSLNNEYKLIIKFINRFHKYKKQIIHEWIYVDNNIRRLHITNHIKFSQLNLSWLDDWYTQNDERSYNHIDINKVTDDFLNLKIFFKNLFTPFESLTYTIDKIPQISHNYEYLYKQINSINKHIDIINNLGNQAIKSLVPITRLLKESHIDFWTLLIIFQQIATIKKNKDHLNNKLNNFKQALQNDNNTSKANTEVGINELVKCLHENKLTHKNENRIFKLIINICREYDLKINTSLLSNVLYDVSLLQDIIDQNSHANWSDVENTIKYFLISLSDVYTFNNKDINNLNYYFNNTTGFDQEFFTSYIYLNEYLDSLYNITYKYINYYMNYEKSSDLTDDSVAQSNALYKFIINKNFKSHQKLVHKILLPSVNQNIIGSLNVSPLIFIILNIYGTDLFNQKFGNPQMTLFSIKFSKIQLKAFENNFSKYLNKCIYSIPKSKYIHDSSELLNDISKQIYQNKLTKSDKYEVLDFNYTPLSLQIKNRNHIHGSLSHKNIIIGIDDTEINNLITKTHFKINKINEYTHSINFINNKFKKLNEFRQALLNLYNYYKNLLKFTKTYRILMMNNKNKDNLFNNNSFKHIDNIIFLGHSLGVNDYPYFEALFDKTNIYNSNTKLIFCYSKFYKGDNEIKRKNNQVPSIVNLLRAYGNTISNKNHGENLISKMLTENRIQFLSITKHINNIKPLPSYKRYY